LDLRQFDKKPAKDAQTFRMRKHLSASLDRGLVFCMCARVQEMMSVEVNGTRENSDGKAHLLSCCCPSNQVLARDDIGKRGGLFDFYFCYKILDAVLLRALPPDHFKPLDILELVYQLQATANFPGADQDPERS